MLSSLGGFVFSVFHRINNWLPCWSEPVTPESFCTLVQANGIDIFNILFEDDHGRVYFPQEYAVHIGNTEVLKRLIAIKGSEVVRYGYNKSPGNRTTLAHFYMQELKDSAPEQPFYPNLDVLRLLLDHLDDVNAQEERTGRTILEAALIHMAKFQHIHWEVIECLLARGIGITGRPDSTTFKRFLGCYVPARSGWGQPMRTAADEQRFLGFLDKYRTLERQYHPEYPFSCLSRGDFKSLTTLWEASLLQVVHHEEDFIAGIGSMGALYAGLVAEGEEPFEDYIRSQLGNALPASAQIALLV